MSEVDYDVLMIGAGPAALSAAVYTTREGISTVLFEKAAIGGMAAITDMIDNYPGFPEGIKGFDLAENLRKQAVRFGAELKYGEITNIERLDDKIVVTDESGKQTSARSILIATGSDYKKMNVPGEKELYARGVHYCATCDGPFYRDKKLVVVGGGNSGVQEALFLTKFASEIDLLVRSEVRASDILKKELAKNDKIKVHTNLTINEVASENDKVTGVSFKSRQTGEDSFISADGVFVFIGLDPNTKFLQNIAGIELDEVGLIRSDDDLQTGIPGVFVAGDVRSGATMQIASAVGEGAKAALKIREYLEELDRE